MTTHTTVLICTRDRADTLARALASHLDLEVPPGVTRDLLVVDNGSSDHTPDVVEAFRRTAPFGVTYLREDRPKGLLRWDVTARPDQNGEKALAVSYESKMELDRNVNIGGFMAR